MKKATVEKQQNYRTMQFRIKKSHELFEYCDVTCLKAKNLYNVANFFIRQAFSGLKKDPECRHENENFVIDTVNSRIEDLNRIKFATFEKKKAKDPEAREPKLFAEIAPGSSRISYTLLDGVFKMSEQADYKALSIQSSQNIIKLVNRDWNSFFGSITEYRVSPGKFLGRPKPPRYADKNGRKTAIFSNQDCKVKLNKKTMQQCLIFPKTKAILNLGTVDLADRKLMEVRIVPNANFYTAELVFQLPESNMVPSGEPDRIIGIDLGVNNFATITNNIGLAPIVVKGGVIKARNQLYNKERAHFFGILRQGMKFNQGQFSTKRLSRLDSKRHSLFKDYFHKLSKTLVSYCVENNIDTIVVGKNRNWKQEVQMRRPAKQNFTTIPYSTFLGILEYKSRAVGIRYITTEESYTSKASFLDRDDMPVFGESNAIPVFSGRRVTRGMYRSASGTHINADVNGSANIIRKVFPTAFDGGRDSGVVKAPFPLSVA